MAVDDKSSTHFLIFIIIDLLSISTNLKGLTSGIKLEPTSILA